MSEMASLEERLWALERGALTDAKLSEAKRTALTMLDEDELEVVEQVVDSIKDMRAQQELASVMEVLDASFGDVPHLVLEKYVGFMEEEYRTLQREGQ